MRFASLGGQSNYAQAGKAVADDATKTFKAARRNSVDFGGLSQTAMKVKAEENIAQTRADSLVDRANIDANKTEKLHDAKMQTAKAGVMRKAGGLIALGMDGFRKEEKTDYSSMRERIERDRNKATEFRTQADAIDLTPKPAATSAPTNTGGTGASNTSTTSSSGGVSTNPITPSGGTVDRAEVYSYLTKDKGLSHNKAYGLMSNIDRESGFDASIRSGDDGGPGGLFQWKGVRQTPTVAKLVNSGDWKGQIDYALTEPGESSAQTFLNTTWESPQAAASHWTRKWERPADPDHDVIKNNNFIAGYTYHQ